MDTAPRHGQRMLDRPWPFIAMTLVGVAIFGYATGVLMGPYVPVLGERMPDLTCLQVAFTRDRLMALLGSFSPEQRTAIASLLVPGDVVFAWGYGLLLTGLLGLLTLRLPGGWQRWGRILMWAPLVASGLDVLEDLALYQMVTIFPARGLNSLPLLAGLCATVKYLCLSVIAPAYGLAGSVKGLTVDRRPGALLVYALVVVNAAAFLARPLQQIPPCF